MESIEKKNRNIFFLVYSGVFYLVLMLSLIVSSFYQINWTNERNVELGYHIYNRLWLTVYIILSFLLLLTVAFQFVSFLNSKGKIKSHKSEFLVAIALIMCLAAYISDRSRELMVLTLLACLSWPIDKKNIILEILLFEISLVLVGFGLLSLGITQDYTYFEHGLRHTLGFWHPNTIGVIVFSIIATFYLLFSYKQIASIHFLLYGMIFSVAICVTYTYTKSRTFLISSSVYILLSYLLQFVPSDVFYFKKGTFLNFTTHFLVKAVKIFPIICVACIVVLSFLYRSFIIPNDNFAYRFIGNLNILLDVGISLFGKDVSLFVLDNTYYYILLSSGLICFICFLIISTASFVASIDKKKKFQIIFLIVLYSYLIMENYRSLWGLTYLATTFSFDRFEDMNLH